MAHWLLRREKLCDGPQMCPDADYQPCAECPAQKLDRALMFTDAGAVLRRALELDRQLSIGLTVTAADMTDEEFTAIQVIRAEREEYSEELRAKEDRERERGAEPWPPT